MAATSTLSLSASSPSATLLPGRRCMEAASANQISLISSQQSAAFGESRLRVSSLSSRIGRGGESVRKPRPLAPISGLFGLGVPELVVIAGVALVLFGPKQLPEVGKSLGKTVKSFQQAAKEFQTEIKTTVDSSPISDVTKTVEERTEKEKEKEKEKVDKV